MVTTTNLQKYFMIGLLLTVVLLSSLGFIYYKDRIGMPERANVLIPGDEARLTTIVRDNFSAFVAIVGEMELSVMDFSEPMALDPPPEG